MNFVLVLTQIEIQIISFFWVVLAILYISAVYVVSAFSLYFQMHLRNLGVPLKSSKRFVGKIFLEENGKEVRKCFLFIFYKIVIVFCFSSIKLLSFSSPS